MLDVLGESAAKPRFFSFCGEDGAVKNLQEAAERICELKGVRVALASEG